MVEYSKQTDANGLAEFELAYGDYSVTVSYDDITVTQDVAFRKNHKNFPIPIGKGKVTATVFDADDNLVAGANVILCTGNYIDFENPDFDSIVGLNITDENGACTLKVLEDMQPSEIDAEIPFGTYYLTALKSGGVEQYCNMIVTISHSNEEVTAILQTPPIASVTITCVDDNQNLLESAWVSINEDEWSDNTNENGVVTFDDVYYGTYSISSNITIDDVDYGYYGEITIDSETVTETITLSPPSPDAENFPKVPAP